MQQTRLPIKKIVIGVILIMLCFVAYYTYSYFNFKVVSTNPPSTQMASWTPFFKINFNQAISKKGLSVSVKPDVLYGAGYVVNNNQLVFNLSVPMNTNQKYTLTVRSVTDQHGQTIKNLVYSFTPKNLPISKLPNDQKEALTARNESSPIYKDPILKHLPYYSVNFNLTASFTTGQNNLPSLVLTAKLFIPAAYTGSLEQQMINQDQQSVLQYISSLGLNPANYTINYSIVSG